jgi:hypothetical protein
MASALALVAAFLFALAAALQQKGALNLPDPRTSQAVGRREVALALVGAVGVALARQSGEEHEEPVASVAIA